MFRSLLLTIHLFKLFFVCALLGPSIAAPSLFNSTFIGKNALDIQCSTGTPVAHFFDYSFCKEPAFKIAHRKTRYGWKYIGDDILDLGSGSTENHWQSTGNECAFTWSLGRGMYIGPALKITRAQLGAAAVQMIRVCGAKASAGIRQGTVQVTPRVVQSSMSRGHTESVLDLYIREGRDPYKPPVVKNALEGVKNTTAATAATS